MELRLDIPSQIKVLASHADNLTIINLFYHPLYEKNWQNNTIFIFQLMIFTTAYKILGSISLFPWFTSKPQY